LRRTPVAPSLPDPVVYPAAVLRVAPDVLPELRKAVDKTLKELSPHLELMQKEGFLPEPWLGDPVSAESHRVYNEHVMGAPDGPFHALLAYERQLVAISERLAQIQRNYDEAEAANADLVGRMA
jgi:hypothetical protein